MDTKARFWQRWAAQLTELAKAIHASSFGKVIDGVMVLYQDMARADVFKHASSMAYITLFSLIPSLAAIFSLISLFSPLMIDHGQGENLIEQGKTFILSNLAAGSGDQVVEYIESFLAKLDVKRIGLTGFAGIVVTLILLIRQIEIALNKIFAVVKPRNIVTRFVYFWTFLTLGTFVLSLSFGVLASVQLPSFFGFLDDSATDLAADPSAVGAAAEAAAANAKSAALESGRRWGGLISLGAQWLFFAFVYQLVPNCKVAIRGALLGGGVAALLLSIASSVYGYYLSTFSNYQAIYGAVAAIPSFLLWLYILWIITLLGAILCHRYQQGFSQNNVLPAEVPLDRATNELLSLRAILPLVLLGKVYEGFHQTGQKVTLASIQDSMNVVPDWLEQSYQQLLDEGLITTKEDPGVEGVWQGALYPVRSGDRLTLAEAYRQLVGEPAAAAKGMYRGFARDPVSSALLPVAATDTALLSRTFYDILPAADGAKGAKTAQASATPSDSAAVIT